MFFCEKVSSLSLYPSPISWNSERKTKVRSTNTTRWSFWHPLFPGSKKFRPIRSKSCLDLIFDMEDIMIELESIEKLTLKRSKRLVLERTMRPLLLKSKNALSHDGRKFLYSRPAEFRTVGPLDTGTIGLTGGWWRWGPQVCPSDSKVR